MEELFEDMYIAVGGLSVGDSATDIQELNGALLESATEIVEASLGVPNAEQFLHLIQHEADSGLAIIFDNTLAKLETQEQRDMLMRGHVTVYRGGKGYDYIRPDGLTEHKSASDARWEPRPSWMIP